MTPAWLLCYLASELYVDNKDTNWRIQGKNIRKMPNTVDVKIWIFALLYILSFFVVAGSDRQDGLGLLEDSNLIVQ